LFASPIGQPKGADRARSPPPHLESPPRVAPIPAGRPPRRYGAAAGAIPVGRPVRVPDDKNCYASAKFCNADNESPPAALPAPRDESGSTGASAAAAAAAVSGSARQLPVGPELRRRSSISTGGVSSTGSRGKPLAIGASRVNPPMPDPDPAGAATAGDAMQPAAEAPTQFPRLACDRYGAVPNCGDWRDYASAPLRNVQPAPGARPAGSQQNDHARRPGGRTGAPK
jgi:hypothetical protein